MRYDDDEVSIMLSANLTTFEYGVVGPSPKIDPAKITAFTFVDTDSIRLGPLAQFFWNTRYSVSYEAYGPNFFTDDVLKKIKFCSGK